MRNLQDNVDIQWQPIVTMVNHPHGCYLCLVKSECSEGYYLDEKYFEYDENHRSSLSDEEAKGVVAFLIPRVHLQYRDDAIKSILRKIEGIKKQSKASKTLNRIHYFIKRRWRL
tara:strand:- start:2067 stop:2408 length:342 start_codon:yes stop_codon:yes gene_type:complete